MQRGARNYTRRMIGLSLISAALAGYGMLARSSIVPDARATQAFPLLWVASFGFWYLGRFFVRRNHR